MLSASDTITNIIKEKNITRRNLAENINTTEQNLYNKMKRDSFSAKELVEIGLKMGLKLAFVEEKSKGKDKLYFIEYNEDELFQRKRKADDKTEAERKEIAMRSAETRKQNKQSE